MCLFFFYADVVMCLFFVFFFFQAEDGIRDLVRSRGLGDVYKRQEQITLVALAAPADGRLGFLVGEVLDALLGLEVKLCLLYTSDAADERSSVDLGDRRIIKKKRERVNTVD